MCVCVCVCVCVCMNALVHKRVRVEIISLQSLFFVLYFLSNFTSCLIFHSISNHELFFVVFFFLFCFLFFFFLFLFRFFFFVFFFHSFNPSCISLFVFTLTGIFHSIFFSLFPYPALSFFNGKFIELP